MAGLRIPCPNCDKALTLPDRSLLGRKAKCPACGHRWVLEEPEEVVLTAAPDPPPTVQEPTVQEPDAAGPGAFAFAEPDTPAGGGSVLKERRRARKRGRKASVVWGGLTAAAVAGALVWLVPRLSAPRPDRPPVQAAPVAEREERAAARASLADRFALTAPADARPVSLAAMPTGVSLVVHLRPAELWGGGGPAAGFRECLGPLASWAGSSLEAFTGYPPGRIEECTLGWILGPRGSTPQLCGVFSFVTPPQRSELVRTLGTRTDQYGPPLYLGDGAAGGGRVVMILDDADAPGVPAGLAIAPAEYAPELTADGGLAVDAVESLLDASVRADPLTVLFRPLDLDLHRNTLFPEAVRPLVDAVREEFHDSAEAACIAVVPGDPFALRVTLRGTTAETAKSLHAAAETKFAGLPDRVLGYVRTLRPATGGRQTVIGRLPAMTAAAATARVAGAEDRLYRTLVKLPPAAGPNLALASLLAWDEGLRERIEPPPADIPADTATLAQKLNREVLIDFRRTPLYEALDFIGGEAEFPVELDGAAVRDAGMTQNMVQTFELGRVPATRALAEIQKNHPELRYVLDKPSPGTLLVTTRAAAERDGLTVLAVGE